MDTGDLVEAVRAHRAVELRYRGGGARIVHPHVVYRTGSGGLRVGAVQVSGATSSGTLPGWRDFELMKISHGRVLDVEFALWPEYDRTASRYRHGVIASA